MMIDTNHIKGKIVEIYTKDWVEDLLIGYIFKYDENGIVFYNIDYRGIGTGWSYVSFEIIMYINAYSSYLKKIKDLFLVKNQQIENFEMDDSLGLKKGLMNWIFKYDKWIRITDCRNEMIGKLCEIDDSWIIVEKSEWIIKNGNGYSVIRLDSVNFFCAYELF